MTHEQSTNGAWTYFARSCARGGFLCLRNTFGALNLIEIEFAGNNPVIAAWKTLFEHFAANHSRSSAESVTPEMPRGEIVKRNNAFEERLSDERQRLLAKVLHAIAKTLGFKAEQLEIFEGGYTPQGWVDVETEQRMIRRFAVELYMGRARFPIAVPDSPPPKDDSAR